jgi:S1-C subfamily serine protease
MKDSSSDLFTYYGAIPGSPASRSDLQIGDKIISVNGKPLLNLEDLGLAIESCPEKRILEVLRGNELISIEIDMSSSIEDNINNSIN